VAIGQPDSRPPEAVPNFRPPQITAIKNPERERERPTDVGVDWLAENTKRKNYAKKSPSAFYAP